MYWIFTIITSAYLYLSAYTYFFSESTIRGVRELGFPDFFRIQLAILKLIAATIILIPGIPTHFKEWAYAGIGLFYITAITAHIAHKDPMIINIINIVLSGLLVASYVYFRKLSGLA